MNAAARQDPHDQDPDTDTAMDQTVYLPNHAGQPRVAVPGSETEYGGSPGLHAGHPEMPRTVPAHAQQGPQGQGRYTYGSGARPLDGYTIKRAIGRGGFGEVYYATSDSGKEVALKLIVRNLEVERRGVVQCMNLKCANLLSIYDLKTNDSGDAFVVMEYVSGPSLAQLLAKHPQGLPPEEARAWLKGLAEGVSYLHDHGIVHRDLKPANLFMEEGVVKVGDYGLAKLLTPSQGTEHSESIGTCHYMAPEIASGKYSKAIDVYAMGVILFEMLTGRVPFDGETVGEVLMKHLTARPDVSPLPEPYRSIVEKALSKDPAKRQARVYDLLPPDDAPKAPGVRFIGGGRAGNPAPQVEEDVLRIEAEDPVFYIGPDTKPPRSIPERLRANLVGWRRPQPQPQPQARRSPQPQPGPQPRVQPAVGRYQPQPQPKPRVQPVVLRPVPTPTPPPAPALLPGPRTRLAELTGSMLGAAPAAGLLSVVTASAFGVDPLARPEEVAFLFAMTLFGSWAALLPAKAAEGRNVPAAFRTLLALGSGGAAGLLAWAVVNGIELGPQSTWHGGSYPVSELTGPGSQPNALGYAGYFALVALVGGLPGMTARDRPRRFRISPAVRVGLAAGLVGLALPFPQPWGLAAAGLSAIVVQSVSPWSETGAVYQRYTAKMAKLEKKFGRRVA